MYCIYPDVIQEFLDLKTEGGGDVRRCCARYAAHKVKHISVKVLCNKHG